MPEPIHIGVRWPRKAKVAKTDFDCVVTRDLKIDPRVLQDFSATLLTDVEQDLVLLAGAVAYTDRVVRRRRGRGWARDLELTLPVNAPHVWRQPAINGSLIDALEYVTGDRWTINFVAGGQRIALLQSSLDFTLGNYVVVPFSDGLDSYLQWQLLKVEEPMANILRVHTSSSASNRGRNKSIDQAGGKTDLRLSLPVALSTKDHPEPSYRSRTFLFYSIAALAAHKFGSSRVVIGENGIGALGPSMVPDGDECPHRTTHPAFTGRLALFLNRLMGSKVVFEHPQLFQTKGQVLSRAVSRGVTGWEATHSCTRGKRDRLSGLPCGVCGGCLLRRTAVAAAGATDGTYFWDNLSGMSLDECRSRADGRISTDNDTDIALHGLLDMASVADLGALDVTSDMLQRAAWALNDFNNGDAVTHAERIVALVRTHAAEWDALRRRYGQSGFLYRREEELKNGTP